MARSESPTATNFTFKIPKRTDVLVHDNNTNTEKKKNPVSTFGLTKILPLFLVVLHVAQMGTKDISVLTGG